MCVRMCVVLSMDIGRGRSFLGLVTEKIQSPGYKTRQNWWAWSSFLEDLLFLSSYLPEPWFSVPCGKQTVSPGQQLAVAVGAGVFCRLWRAEDPRKQWVAMESS